MVVLAWLVEGTALLLYLRDRRRNSRSLRTAGLLVVGVVGLTVGLFRVATSHPRFLGTVLVVLAAVGALTVIILAVFLILNGVLSWRLEGRSLATSLSLILGVVLVAGPVVTGQLLRLRTGVAFVLGGGVAFVQAYAGVVFVLFLVFATVQGRRTRPEEPARTIVVLGSKIIRGEAPPLLRSRLDLALELYRDSRHRLDRAPLMITSGGQGADESRSESSAMTDYLLVHGAEPDDVRSEDRSTSTQQNLIFSREVQRTAGLSGPIVVVTNNYHVLRTALHARRLGIDADVVGAPTATYYVPNAIIREFLATAVDQRRLHLVLLSMPAVALIVLLIVALTSK